IRMSRSEQVFDIAVILALLVGIFDEQPYRGAGREAFKHARQDFDLIFFATLRGKARCARFATVEIMLQIGFGQRHAGRTTINDTAERKPVAFTKRGHAKKLAYGITRHEHSRQKSEKRGR